MSRVGALTLCVCYDCVNTKFVYRFFVNDCFSEANILSFHFASTRERFVVVSVFFVLILHDTTDFFYCHEDLSSIGIIKKLFTSFGRLLLSRFYTICGMLVHSSLLTTRDVLSLCLSFIKFWNCDKFHVANALKRKINLT